MRTFRFITLSLVVGAVLLFMASKAQATFPGQNGKIAFVGNQTGTWQLYTMDPDGSHQTQITSLPSTTWELWLPAFSPDGRRILFTHDTQQNPCPPGAYLPAGCGDLYVVNVDGTGLNRLTSDGLSWNGTWSPDGTRIVFSQISTLTNVNVVTIMSADGTGPRTGLTGQVWDSSGTYYTPNGNQIVFYSQNGGFVSTTWIMDADGKNQKRLTPAALEGFPASVSPNGKHILLTSHVNTDIPGAIFTMDLDGAYLAQLTEPPSGSADSATAYSPDGKKILFLSNRLTPGSLDIFTMNVDGTDIQRIAFGLTVGGCPDNNCVGATWGPKPAN
jgi:Tol biopolymer transport system component